MGKSLFQTLAELVAGAHPDVLAATARGHMTAVYSGSKQDCEYEKIRLENAGISASLVGTSEIGTYMACTSGKK